MLLKFVFKTTKTARSREKLLSEGNNVKEESNPSRKTTASEIVDSHRSGVFEESVVEEIESPFLLFPRITEKVFTNYKKQYFCQ